jgi:hypothetical protein
LTSYAGIAHERLTHFEWDSRMGDHFWPALYPGIIVGLLYGLSLRGLPNIVLGALGGLVGSAVACWGLLRADLNEGLPSVVGMIVLALLGAYVATALYARISNGPPGGK